MVLVLPRAVCALLACALALTAAPAARAQPISGNQLDTFQDATTNNWTNGGGGNPPQNIASGGPGGGSDRFLEVISSGGGGSGSRLVVFNRTQWKGDYFSPGVTGVEMDLKSISGTAPLHMRIALKSGLGQFDPGYESTNAFDLPADGNWHHAVFGFNTGSLTAVNGPASLDTLLGSVAEFRILSATTAGNNMEGDAVAAMVGIDNIHALGAAAPEPGTFLLTLVGTGLISATVAARRRREQKRVRSSDT